MQKHKVFVYGTLKKGFRANHLLAKSSFVSEAKSILPFSMVGTGFPQAYLDTKGHPVKGEIYEITEETLLTLDYYEGYPGFYSRKVFPFEAPEGNTTAVMYYIDHPVTGEKVPPKEGVLEWV